MKRCLLVAATVVLAMCAQREGRADELPLAILPFTNTYESLSGSIISNPAVGCWTTSNESAMAYITNVTYTAPILSALAIDGEPHQNIMVFSGEGGEIVNSFDTNSTINFPEVWVDTMIQPVFSEDLLTNVSVMTSQLSICFDTNGYINVYHGALTNGQTGADRWQTPADTRLWSAYNLKTVSSGEWVRLAVQMKYNFNRGVSMFRVLLNNKELTNEFGYSSYTVSTATQPGPWTRCANDILSLNAIALSGAGALDDLLISTNQPSGQSKPTITVTVAGPGTVSPSEVVIMPSDGASTNFSITANSPWSYIKTLQTNGTSLADVEAAKTNSHELSWPDVMGDNTLKVVFDVRTVTSGVPVPIPYQWLDEQGLGSANVTDDALWTSNALSDYDNDGALTWEEYVAGTQPTNDASVLKVLSQTIDTNRVLQVMWLGSPGTLGNIDYELQASTNLSDWSTTQQRTSPAPGTNTWPVGTLDQTRSFYRIRLTTP